MAHRHTHTRTQVKPKKITRSTCALELQRKTCFRFTSLTKHAVFNYTKGHSIPVECTLLHWALGNQNSVQLAMGECFSNRYLWVPANAIVMISWKCTRRKLPKVMWKSSKGICLCIFLKQIKIGDNFAWKIFIENGSILFETWNNRQTFDNFRPELNDLFFLSLYNLCIQVKDNMKLIIVTANWITTS